MPETAKPQPVYDGYQLRVGQEVLLALLATEAAHGYELRARLRLALGPLGDTLNAGQVYVTLGRLENAGLIEPAQRNDSGRADRKSYSLTAAGRERLETWLHDTAWPKPTASEFHLKLVAAASAGLADPIRLVDRQRHAVLEELATAQRAALAQADESVAALLLEGVVLRLQADLRWLEACAAFWTSSRRKRR